MGATENGVARAYVLMQQHVLRLEVTVDEAQQVEVLQRQQHLRRVEASGRLLEPRVRLLEQQVVQLAAAAVLHEEVHVVVGLELGEHGGQERVV